MARQLSLPQHLKIVQMLKPQTTNGALTSQVISLKNAHKAWIVLEFTQAAGFASTPTLQQATSIAAGTNKASSDTLVRKSDAASYAVAADVKNKQVVFEIDPTRLDGANGYDCIYLTMATSSQASNFVSATAYLDTRYKQATPPSAIVD